MNVALSAAKHGSTAEWTQFEIVKATAYSTGKTSGKIPTDISVTEEEWDVFVALLEGGRVKKRAETASAGSRGPWMYLYWNGDRSKFQEFSFASPGAQSAFEEFCGELKNQTSHDDLFGEQYGKKGSRSK